MKTHSPYAGKARYVIPRLALVFTVALGSCWADSVTLTSSVAQSGLDTTIGNGPLRITAPSGYDFAGQAYSSLADIDTVSVTMTLNDADSAVGNLDYNKLTLGLDGINTGILLNGFRDSRIDTLTITGTPAATSIQPLLSALRTDGKLVGGIVSTDKPSSNEIGIPATSNTTLSITGAALPSQNWGVSLDNPNLSGASGSSFIYSGTISNSTGENLVLSDASVVFSAPGANAFLTDSFLNTLGVIGSDGYAGSLFEIDGSKSPAPGIWTGALNLDAEGIATPSTISTPFQLTITDTPEPATVSLALLGAVLLRVAMTRSRTGRH